MYSHERKNFKNILFGKNLKYNSRRLHITDSGHDINIPPSALVIILNADTILSTINDILRLTFQIQNNNKLKFFSQLINYSYIIIRVMGAITEPRSVDSSDRSNLMRAFIIGNGINWARLSYDLMDALSPDRGFVPPTALKKTDRSPQTKWSLHLIIVIFLVAIGVPYSLGDGHSIKGGFITQIHCHFVSPKRTTTFSKLTLICGKFYFLYYNDRPVYNWDRRCLHYLRWYGYSSFSITCILSICSNMIHFCVPRFQSIFFLYSKM